VSHHVYEEEGNWFLELKEKVPEDEQAQLTQRYQEEFERYVGDETPRMHTRRPATRKTPQGRSNTL
jgi:hypothetical protein